MNIDPFGDPFKAGFGANTSDIFRRPRSGAVSRPRKEEPKPEPESEPQAGDAGESDEGTVKEGEAPKDKVVLKNSVWEVEEVGFNERYRPLQEAEGSQGRPEDGRVLLPVLRSAGGGGGDSSARAREGHRRAQMGEAGADRLRRVGQCRHADQGGGQDHGNDWGLEGDKLMGKEFVAEPALPGSLVFTSGGKSEIVSLAGMTLALQGLPFFWSGDGQSIAFEETPGWMEGSGP